MTGTPKADPRSTDEIASYHAHIYYDPAVTRTEAEQLRTWIGWLKRSGSSEHLQPAAGPYGRSDLDR